MNRILPLMAGGLAFALASCTTSPTTPASADRPSPKVADSAPVRPADLGDANRRSHAGDFSIANLIFEQYIAEHPKDANGPLFFALSLGKQAAGIDNPEEARLLRRRAREQMLGAQRLGSTDPLVAQFLTTVPADGSPQPKSPLSPDQSAAVLMADAEKAYARADYAAAAQLHQQALILDPHNYQAALLCGDAYFAARNFPAAIEWFARAVAIDPDVETAHRYWADALARQGKVSEATDRFLEAVVADPYNRLARDRFRQFGESLRPPLRAKPMQLPSAGVGLRDGKVAIKIGPPDDKFETALSFSYAAACAKVRTEAFSRLFPKEAKPRRSLPEEVAGLRTMSRVAKDLVQAKPSIASPEEIAKWRPALETLDQIERDGLLEAYALFQRADQELAQDYVGYRAAHRDQLVRFLRRYWCGLD